MRDEEFGKRWVFMDYANQRGLSHSRNRRLMNRRRCGHPHGSCGQTALAKEVAFPQYGKDCLLATLRQNRELHVSPVDVEHRIRRISLREDGIVVSVLPASLSRANFLEKYFAIQSGNVCICHTAFLRANRRPRVNQTPNGRLYVTDCTRNEPGPLFKTAQSPASTSERRKRT